MYETFDHTADVGLRVRAPDLKGLFEDAARGLFSILVANPQAIQSVEEIAFTLEGSRRDDLLFDWLAELLYTFDTRRMLLCRFDVNVNKTGLSAIVAGEPIDPDRHDLQVEIKAITYHGLKVQPDGEGWLAEVIVDL